MNTGWITALSAIMGSLVGALTSVLTTYVIIASYSRPNLTAEQLRGFTPQKLHSRANESDLLKKFGEACRKELNAIYSMGGNLPQFNFDQQRDRGG